MKIKIKKVVRVCSLVFSLAACASAQETRRVYLSGTDKAHTVDWRFQCTAGRNAGEWSAIPVPSQWEMQGFGTLNYKKDVGPAVNERGLYELRFPSDPAWSGQRVLLVFEGVMTDATVRMNGRSAGPTHQGGYYRFSYEVTDLLSWESENLLEVDVAKHSANPSVNDAERLADYWVFGGIYRPVYLKVVPQEFIERVAINAQADGNFAADAYLSSAGNGGLSLEAQIQTLDGTCVGDPFAVDCSTDGPTRVTGQLNAPLQWTAETPDLYQCEFRLKRGDTLLHRMRQRFGFRTIEVREGDGIYVNGQRVVLKGVNRHSTWPDSGRCLSEEVHRLDIETIKAMNMNAVRMSHYPPDAEFLDLCDELGLYVLDELAGWHRKYDTHVGRKLVEEMVTRDVNHPCILFWNNGNEGGYNVSLDEVFGWFDPQQRRVLHPWEAYKGINAAHYLEYDRALVASRGAPTRHGWGQAYQEWEDLNDPNQHIYMPTEMLHGLYDGGSGAGLEDYWTMMRESPLLGGAFLWNLFDEGVRRADGRIDTETNKAPDGITGPYREREASFHAIKQLWSPIQLKLLEGSRIAIQNDYSFTNADQCRLSWQLREFPVPHEQADDSRTVAESECSLPSIPPGGSGELNLELPEISRTADALAVRVDDPTGRELWTWVWPVDEFHSDEFTRSRASDPVAAEETPEEFVVTAGELRLAVSRRDGLLVGAKRGGQAYSLENGPIATPGDSELQEVAAARTGDAVTISAKYVGAMQAVTWTIHPSGWVDCEYAYQAEGDFEYLGVTFDYPETQVRGKRWLGDGPIRVWKNRRAGVSLGVWQNEYNNTITGYSGWQYPEFKGCFANVHWLQLQTTEGPITIVPHQRNAFVQVLTPEQPPEDLRGKTSYELPNCGLALLDGIPAVGSKFKPADTTGPQGQLNHTTGELRGRVSFFFGDLPAE